MTTVSYRQLCREEEAAAKPTEVPTTGLVRARILVASCLLVSLLHSTADRSALRMALQESET
jgi:hypothetical protein